MYLSVKFCGDIQRKMGQALLSLLLLLGSAILYSCNKDKDERPVIAVSFESQKWLVQQIAGDDYKVVALLPSGSDPELFDPDMGTMKALEKAELFMTTSTLGFESQVKNRIQANYPELKIVDLSEGIDQLMHTHSVSAMSAKLHHDHGHATSDHQESDGHAIGDPHLLSSVRNARIIARNILASLSVVNPEAGEKYCKNYADLDAELLKTDLEIDSVISARNLKGASFIVMHPSLSYYARDYGLHQLPVESDGKEVSPRQLEQRLQQARAQTPRALFYEKGNNEAQARQLAESIGIEAYPLSLNSGDFISEIIEITDNLTKDKTDE